MENIKYPIGKFSIFREPNHDERIALISSLHLLPDQLRETVRDLSEEQLETPYREGGWTIRQVAHHIADSHLNGYIRFKWALTEEQPLIKVYHQDAWAQTSEAKSAPVLLSVTLLKALHNKWIVLLKKMSDEDYARKFEHPETGPSTLGIALALFEWHGRHHVAQIQSLRQRLSWE